MIVFRGSSLLWLLLVFLSSFNCHALNQITLSLDQVDAEKWQLEGLNFSFTGLLQERQKLELTINQLAFPKPLDTIKLIKIRCPEIIVDKDRLSCPEGIADLKSSWLNSSKIPFSFFYSKQQSHFHLGKARLAGGFISVDAWMKNGRWKAKLVAKNLDIGFIKNRLKTSLFPTFTGRLDVDMVVKGKASEASTLNVKLTTKNWKIQNQEASVDTQNLNITTNIHATNRHQNWNFSSQMKFVKGSVYVEPLYVVAGNKPLSAKVNGVWLSRQNQLVVEKINFVHPDVLNLQAQGRLISGQPVDLEGTLQIENLDTASKVYLAPFFTATAMEGVGFTGKLNVNFKLVHQSLTDLQLSFSQLGVSDTEGRISLQGGVGGINWPKQAESTVQSRLFWKKLSLFKLPIAASELIFSTTSNSLQLDKSTALPFLGGEVILKQFSLQFKDSEKPDVHFQGAIRNVSLEQLTEKLNWQPLTGVINGEIPGISYRNDRLSIDGILKVQVFDGEIRISDLAVSGLFSPLPKLYLEMDIDRLDLDQLTRKFDFGRMQGRLSGEIRDLYLENWKPVSFFAWIGTPEDDDSPHRISQKAVNNLASIGGGGAVDVLSRTFLRFFETFGYDKVGIGCYLHNGVCQLMGVGPAEQGYYIVKGGGLPRIDVIGYNPRVDWNVLLQRLNRINQSRATN